MSIEKRLILKQDIMAYMSQEGYDKLVADLQYLESVERPKASAAIAEQVMNWLCQLSRLWRNH